ncbi:MAG: MFS transporter [Dongiaceae bacterium]
MASNFADRQVVAALFPQLKAEWGLSDLRLGLLSSIVSLVIAVGALPIAVLIDRGGRPRKIAAMGGFWSIATLGCALAGSYPMFLAGRALIGLGEAGFAPAGGALLADLFPARWRATVLGAFQSAASVGAILGIALGGAIAALWGWRAALAVLALPGLVLAVLALSISTPGERSRAAAPLPSLRTLAALLRPRSARAAYVGGSVQLLLISTLHAWLPSYFGRAYGWPVGRAAAAAAGMLLIGAIGIVLWGHLADRLTRHHASARLSVPAACALAGFLLLSAAFGALHPGAAQLVLIGLGCLAMTATIGPLAAVVTAVTPVAQRASALGMLASIQNLFGLAAGPLIAGALSDAFGLDAALALLPASSLIVVAALIAGARFYPAETSTDEPRGRPTAMAAS